MPRRPLILAATMMAMFMAAVESTIVATAMPTVTAELGGFHLFSWVFAIYLLTQAVSIPIYGKLADLYGRKRVFCVGSTLFLVGSTLCGFAPSMVMLIVFRALQGLGAGAIVPIASVIAGDIYTPAERARIQGYIGSVWGFSAIVGPALGAFLVEHLHWSVVFWVNLPIGVAAMAMLALFLHERQSPHRHQIDYLGAMLLTLGTGALMLALVQADLLGPTLVAALLAFAAVALTAFIAQQRRAAEPMMSLHIWRMRVIAINNVGALAAGAMMMGIMAFMPTYVQAVLGRDAATAGSTLAVMSIGWPVASTIAGRLMVRTSYRYTAIIGALFLIAGSVVLITLETMRSAVWAGTGTFLIGAGMGFLNTTFLVSAQSSVGWGERGVATSSNLFMRMVGQSLGAALYGALLNIGLQRVLPGAGEVVTELMEPASRRGMAPAELERLTGAVAGVLHDAYFLSAALAVLTLGIVLCLPAQTRPETTAHAD